MTLVGAAFYPVALPPAPAPNRKPAMDLIPEVVAQVAELRAWRRHLHAHPETAFEEAHTNAFVAEKLSAMGLEVHTGLGKTGVIGVLHGEAPRDATLAIGLRADLDALHIHERTGLEHASRHHGKMHACGHDRHMTMLLCAASALSQGRGSPR